VPACSFTRLSSRRTVATHRRKHRPGRSLRQDIAAGYYSNVVGFRPDWFEQLRQPTYGGFRFDNLSSVSIAGWQVRQIE